MNIDKKAREYAIAACSGFRYFNVLKKEDLINYTTTDFLSGYETAITDLSTENAQLREVLSLAYNLINDSTEYEVGIVRYKEGLLKINELLTDNKKEE